MIVEERREEKEDAVGFRATIVFTGICGVVPKKNFPDPPGAFCVVLPNAWKPEPDPVNMKASSVDQVSRLCRHAAFVYFSTSPRDVENIRQDNEGLWFLGGGPKAAPIGHRLFIKPKSATGQLASAAWGDISGLASFEDIAAPEHRKLLSVEQAVKAPKASLVAAQVFVENGTLSSEKLNIDWVFDGYLHSSAPPKTKKLNYQVVVTLDGLDSLEVVQEDFAGNPGKTFTFSKGPAFVTVANLCDLNPLQWGGAPPPDSLPDDDDFRLHYEIVDNAADLAAELDPFRCPIPRVTRAFTGGNGLNCLPLRFPGVGF